MDRLAVALTKIKNAIMALVKKNFKINLIFVMGFIAGSFFFKYLSPGLGVGLYSIMTIVFLLGAGYLFMDPFFGVDSRKIFKKNPYLILQAFLPVFFLSISILYLAFVRIDDHSTLQGLAIAFSTFLLYTAYIGTNKAFNLLRDRDNLSRMMIWCAGELNLGLTIMIERLTDMIQKKEIAPLPTSLVFLQKMVKYEELYEALNIKYFSTFRTKESIEYIETANFFRQKISHYRVNVEDLSETYMIARQINLVRFSDPKRYSEGLVLLQTCKGTLDAFKERAPEISELFSSLHERHNFISIYPLSISS